MEQFDDVTMFICVQSGDEKHVPHYPAQYLQGSFINET